MTPTEQKTAARDFAVFWTGKGYEKGQTQPFWIGLLRVLGVEHPDQGFIEFEDKAHIDARRLENEALAALLGNEMRLDLGDLVKVSISQFHGIEINDFAVAVAKTALWIAVAVAVNEVLDGDFLRFDVHGFTSS